MEMVPRLHCSSFCHTREGLAATKAGGYPFYLIISHITTWIPASAGMTILFVLDISQILGIKITEILLSTNQRKSFRRGGSS